MSAYCRRCRRSHRYRLPDETGVDDVLRMEDPCPRGTGSVIWVSLGATGTLVRMNTRNLAALLAKLDRLQARHLRRAKLAEARDQRARRVVEAEGDGFRWA